MHLRLHKEMESDRGKCECEKRRLTRIHQARPVGSETISVGWSAHRAIGGSGVSGQGKQALAEQVSAIDFFIGELRHDVSSLQLND